MDPSKTKPAREGWHGVKCADLNEMRTENIRFWQAAGGAVIRRAAWELVIETWQVQGRDPDELRFQRLAPTIREA